MSSRAIQALESRRLLSASGAGDYTFDASHPLTLTNAGETSVPFTLSGAGTGTVHVDDAGGWSLQVGGTTAKSSVSVGAGARLVAVSRAAGAVIGALQAPGAELDGTLDLAAGSVSLGNVDAGSTLALAANGKGGKGFVSFSAVDVTDASLASQSAVKALAVNSWTGGGSVSAPSVSALTSKGDFSPTLQLTGTKGTTLAAASGAGTASGDWTLAASAGKLTVSAVRGHVEIGGNVKQLSVGDHVALLSVASATGGSIHVGGKGKLAAPGDAFGLLNTSLYTCTDAMYSYDELQRVSHVGQTTTVKDNGKKLTDQILATTTTVNGRTAYTEQSSDGSSNVTSLAEDGTAYAETSVEDDAGGLTETLTFTGGMQLSPATYTLGQAYTYSAPFTGTLSDGTSTAQISGTNTITTQLVGHVLLKTAVGTFVVAKLQNSVEVDLTGTISGTSSTAALSGRTVSTGPEYASPERGQVLSQQSGTSSLTVDANGKSSTRKQKQKQVTALLEGPTQPS